MQETVTVQDFRRMQVGQARTFTLADKKKVRPVRVTASTMKDNEGMEFTVNKVPRSERTVDGRTSVKVKITRNR
jgi:hypothetical protein